MKIANNILKSSSAVLLCYLLLFCFSNAGAQTNYVLNPSLEEYDSCPVTCDLIFLAKYWSALDTSFIHYQPTDGQPEYCNICGIGPCVSVPTSEYYYHYPRTGNGMAQMQLFFDESYANPYKRDYLQGRFFKSLIAGKNYCVTFYVTLEQASEYAINHIGAYLDNGYIDTTIYPGLPQTEYTPQILKTSIITDTLNWVKVQGSFTANGTEKFITIGNFFSKSNTNYILDDTWNLANNFTWYLVDDISVIESDHVAFAGNDTTIYKGDSILLGEIAVPYAWYKDSSSSLSLIDSTSGSIWVKPDSTTTYVVKQTLCGVVTWDTVVVSVVPVGVKIVGTLKNVLVYPNPVQNELVVENAVNCTIHMFDVVGKEVYRGAINTGKELINTSNFGKGIYFLELQNDAGWQQIQKIVK